MNLVILPSSGVTPGTFRQFSGYKACAVVDVGGVGIVAAVCSTKAQGLDASDGRWHVVCETHGALVGCERLADAKREMDHTADFCEECMELYRAVVPLCDACLGACHAGGEPDFPYRSAAPDEPCGAADHQQEG